MSGARGKYIEITTSKFLLNYFSSKDKGNSSQNKTKQNDIKLNLNLNSNKIKRNKFGFPYSD